MKTVMIMMMALVTSSSAFAGAVIEKDSVVLTGAHSAEVRAFLRKQSSRTQNFIKVVGQLTVEGSNVRIKGANLGQVSDLRDAKLNQLGNAFGQNAAGTVFIRGTLAAYLVDHREIRRFDCQNTQNSGAIGFPGSLTSACELR